MKDEALEHEAKGGGGAGRVVLTVILCLLLLVAQTMSTLMFSLSSAVTPSHVKSLVTNTSLLTTLASSSSGDVDESTAQLLATLTSDDAVKNTVGDYLGEVVSDIRNGTNVASLNGLELKEAVLPYMGDFVDQTYPDIVASHPLAKPYLNSAAADQVVSSLQDSMGDWKSLLDGMGVSSGTLSVLRALLSPWWLVVAIIVCLALGIAIMSSAKRRDTGLLCWGILALALGAIFLVAGISSCYVSAETSTMYSAILGPLNSSLSIAGVVQMVCGLLLVIISRVVKGKTAIA